MDANDLVTVYTGTNLPEAEAIREALEGLGIACKVGSENTLTGVTGVAVYVRAIDSNRAQKFIEQHHAPRKSWTSERDR